MKKERTKRERKKERENEKTIDKMRLVQKVSKMKAVSGRERKKENSPGLFLTKCLKWSDFLC